MRLMQSGLGYGIAGRFFVYVPGPLLPVEEMCRVSKQARHAASGIRSHPVTIRLRNLYQKNNANEYGGLDGYAAQECRRSRVVYFGGPGTGQASFRWPRPFRPGEHKRESDRVDLIARGRSGSRRPRRSCRRARSSAGRPRPRRGPGP